MEDVLKKIQAVFGGAQTQPPPTPNEVLVRDEELYRREHDPDNGVIYDAKQRVTDLTREIRQNEQKLAAMTTQQEQLREQRKRYAKQGNTTAVAQIDSRGLALTKAIKALEAKTARLRTRCANFEFGSDNLRDMKDEADDERLLREMNLRMQMRLEQQDPLVRRQAVEKARFVNFQAGQMQALMNQSLQLDDGAMQDDRLLEEFRGFGLEAEETTVPEVIYDEVLPPVVVVKQQKQQQQTQGTATLDSQY